MGGATTKRRRDCRLPRLLGTSEDRRPAGFRSERPFVSRLRRIAGGDSTMSGRIKRAADLPRRNGNAAVSLSRKESRSVHGNNGTHEETLRVAKLEPPTKPVSFGEWRDVIAQNFPALVKSAEICASVVAQLLLKDVANPFALVLVDAPSS